MIQYAFCKLGKKKHIHTQESNPQATFCCWQGPGTASEKHIIVATLQSSVDINQVIQQVL